MTKKVTIVAGPEALHGGIWPLVGVVEEMRSAGVVLPPRVEDLAREALVEKRRYTSRTEGLENELAEHEMLIDKYQDDIRQLEEKLKSARDKQRMLVQRHIHASRKRKAQEEIRRVDSTEAMMKFDELQNRIEHMEADAELVNFGKKSSLEHEIDRLSVDDEIEKELQALKKPAAKQDESTPAD